MENFSGHFKLNLYDGRRPHLMFGSYESLSRQAPYILPSFHNKYNFYLTYFQKFVPHADDAEFTVEADREVTLCTLLSCYFYDFSFEHYYHYQYHHHHYHH